MDIYAITNELGESLSRSEIVEKLADMGISDEAIRSGDSNAIMEDAASKGIGSQALQDALEPTINGSGDNIQADYQSELKSKGLPENVIAQGQSAMQAFAMQNGIELPPPPSGAKLNIKS